MTGLNTSVAFWLGVIVPLYNRDYVTRREIIPYTLGGNGGTLSDTFVVAMVLGTEAGIAVITTLAVIGLAVTLVALAGYGPY